ncbi:GntR family transcriptional regulator [Nocardioides sp. Soil805]|uniref:GntR family transcriptional regulator n=1 Tax=Nocardioides sp. Soil805 TaxID=1736416 RepID=UPI00138F4440|nr:GntR family transcriptional regulator [Nocardioides sp. Soil805]
MISRQRLADQVYAVLRGQILARELVPGDHLSVPVLAETLGLSRSPVREAVQRLVVEGLAVEEFHRGARVAGVDATDLADVYAVRGVLEGLAARLAAGRRDAALLTVLRASVAEHGAAIKAGDEQAIIAADQAFHQAVLDAARNEHLTRALGPLLGRAQVAMLSGDLSRWPRKALAEHRAILAAIRMGDAEAAQAAASAHVQAVLTRHQELG